MPLAPVVAAALNVGLPTRAKALYIDGLDVVKMGNGAGVDPADVRLTWAGAGQVSALAFVLKDPQRTLAPTAGQRVVFMNLTTGQPLFTGWITDVRYDTYGLGRRFRISCAGAEILLDWSIVPARTYVAGNTLAAIIQDLVSSATPLGVSMNVAANAGLASPNGSTVAAPIASFFNVIGNNTTFTTPAGSLRRALEYAVGFTLADTANNLDALRQVSSVVTVDRWLGLRVYSRQVVGSVTIDNAGGSSGGDHQALVISDAGPNRPTRPSAGYSGTDAARVVQVKGSGVTVTVSDGSGVFGRAASISDPATGIQGAQAAGWAYLANQQSLLTGHLTLETAPGAGSGTSLIDVLSRMTFSDASLGLSAVDTQMQRIQVTFAPSGEETWDIDFGVTLATGAAYVRSLTQDQLI